MKNAGGEVDFEYDHSVYWPALAKLAEERRAARTERWEKAGKLVGESEIYLWGGEEPSVGAATQPTATAAAPAPAAEPAVTAAAPAEQNAGVPAEPTPAATPATTQPAA